MFLAVLPPLCLPIYVRILAPALSILMLIFAQANPLGGAIGSLVLPQTPTVNWAVSL